MKTIFSMLSNDQVFPSFIKKNKGKVVSAAKVKTAILIKGGANVADGNRNTAKFVETQISEEEFKTLEAYPTFNRMIERGFFSLKKPNETKKDKCSPLVERDIKNKNAKVEVYTNKEVPE